VAITVSDRGVGIEPRDLHRVFDKFYSTWRRMDSRTQGGLGLGLTLSREIVRAHGGDLQVRSEVGRGSTFTVFLPAPAPIAAEAGGETERPAEETRESLGGRSA
jgi:signal transduction histidine kinase